MIEQTIGDIRQTEEPPSLTEPKTFSQKAFAFVRSLLFSLADLRARITELNTFKTQANALAEGANVKAGEAATSAANAANSAGAASATLSSVYAARDIANAAKTDAINAFLNAQRAIKDSGLNYPQTAARQKADFFGLSHKL